MNGKVTVANEVELSKNMGSFALPLRKRLHFTAAENESPLKAEDNEKPKNNLTKRKLTLHDETQRSKKTKVKKSKERRGDKDQDRLDSSSGQEKETTEDEEVYCLCRRPYDPEKDEFMIACDICDGWYHGACVGVTQEESKSIKEYVCPPCAKKKELKSPKIRLPKTALPQTDRSVTSSLGEHSKKKPQGEKRCQHKTCTQFAKTNSKYCSHNCGIAAAKEALKNGGQYQTPNSGSKLHKSKEDEDHFTFPSAGMENSQLSHADRHDLHELKLLCTQETDLKKQIVNLEERTKRLEKFILFASSLYATSADDRDDNTDLQDPKKMRKDGRGKEEESEKTELDTVDPSPHLLGTGNETVDCISCGQPVVARNFSRHSEQCFVKKELHLNPSLKNGKGHSQNGSKVYCHYFNPKTQTHCTQLLAACPFHSVSKKNINEELLCGCPLSSEDYEGKYCELPRKLCLKHVNWETLRNAELAQELRRLETLLSEVKKQKKIVKERVKRRRNPNSSEDTVHRTIIES